jgi:hypothetical protein
MGFYPTPMSVVTLMEKMTFVPGDQRCQTVNDPCVGTGRMLLAASNRSLRLSGQDIQRRCVLATFINGALYAPWLSFPLPAHLFQESPVPPDLPDEPPPPMAVCSNGRRGPLLAGRDPHLCQHLDSHGVLSEHLLQLAALLSFGTVRLDVCGRDRVPMRQHLFGPDGNVIARRAVLMVGRLPTIRAWIGADLLLCSSIILSFETLSIAPQVKALLPAALGSYFAIPLLRLNSDGLTAKLLGGAQCSAAAHERIEHGPRRRRCLIYAPAH